MTQTEYREIRGKRSIFGKLVALIFWGFHVFMLIWVIGGVMVTRDMSGAAMSEAERAGHAIGSAIGFGSILFLWAVGTVILGAIYFATRPAKSLVPYERTADVRPPPAKAPPRNKASANAEERQ